jgi:hypothetical protein
MKPTPKNREFGARSRFAQYGHIANCIPENTTWTPVATIWYVCQGNRTRYQAHIIVKVYLHTVLISRAYHPPGNSCE